MLKAETTLARTSGTRGESNPHADLVLLNGTVYSADAGQNLFQAIAVGAGRIVYRGSDSGARKWVGSDTEVIDLEGKTVLPGFRDAHVHPFMGAIDMMECSLVGLARVEEYLDRVRVWVQEHPEEEGIRGSGWLYSSFGVDGPHKAELDQVVSDRPVLLKAIDGHSAWANSKALALAGIDRRSPDPPGGKIERDAATGEPTGALREWTAIELVESLYPEWETERLADALRAFLESAARCGLTAVHDAMVSREYLAAYLSLEKRRELTLRISASLLCEPEEGENSVADLILLRRSHPSSLVTARSVKIFVDGVVEGHTALLLAPYEDRPEFRGEPLWDPENLKRTVAALDGAGFQVHFHAVGDGAVRMALDSVEYARQINGFRDSRHQIAHLDLVSEEDIARFHNLGVIANFQPLWLLETGSTGVDDYLLGAERSRRLYPMQEIFSARGTITCGSDWPVGAEHISLNPLESIRAGLSGMAPSGREFSAGRRQSSLALKTMLDFYTRNAAYASFQEDVSGSVEVGKLADLVVLDQDLLAIPVDELDQVKVLLTILEGWKAYRDPVF